MYFLTLVFFYIYLDNSLFGWVLHKTNPEIQTAFAFMIIRYVPTKTLNCNTYDLLKFMFHEEAARIALSRSLKFFSAVSIWWVL